MSLSISCRFLRVLLRHFLKWKSKRRYREREREREVWKESRDRHVIKESKESRGNETMVGRHCILGLLVLFRHSYTFLNYSSFLKSVEYHTYNYESINSCELKGKDRRPLKLKKKFLFSIWNTERESLKWLKGRSICL